MDILTTEQNFQLTEAIDWIDTLAEEVLDSDDSSLIDFEDSSPIASTAPDTAPG